MEFGVILPCDRLVNKYECEEYDSQLLCNWTGEQLQLWIDTIIWVNCERKKKGAFLWNTLYFCSKAFYILGRSGSK